MIIGVPAELKTAECRVAITPDGVRELKALGHQILVEAGAGTGSSLSDADFAAAGATLVDDDAAGRRVAPRGVRP
jgi:alanine dehydrogenase